MSVGIPTVQFKKLHEHAQVPTKGYAAEDAGFDLYSITETLVMPGEHRDISTGIAIAMPPGFWARIVSRSSTSRQFGLHVVEGIIDNGWRGELFINVHNPGRHVQEVGRGKRLAQLILHRIEYAQFEETGDLPKSERGTRGFGSTGR